MGKLKMLMGMFFLFVLFGMFSSCTSEDENLAALNEEKEYVIKAASSKAQFKNDLKQVLGSTSVTRSNRKHDLTKEQITLLQNSAVSMLKDEGMYSADMDKLVKQNNAGIVFVGLAYLSMAESKNHLSRSLYTRSLKTRSESTECFSPEKLQSCIQGCVLSTIGVGIVGNILNGYVTGTLSECLTRAVVKKILSKIASSFVGCGVGLTIELTVCVWECMDINI